MVAWYLSTCGCLAVRLLAQLQGNRAPTITQMRAAHAAVNFQQDELRPDAVHCLWHGPLLRMRALPAFCGTLLRCMGPGPRFLPGGLPYTGCVHEPSGQMPGAVSGGAFVSDSLATPVCAFEGLLRFVYDIDPCSARPPQLPLKKPAHEAKDCCTQTFDCQTMCVLQVSNNLFGHDK